jgi:protein arginine N-methyltransferase 2
MEVEGIDLETRIQEILLAASNHDLVTLKPFLRIPGAASVQDSETGFTPLHAAIAACESASAPEKTKSEPYVSKTPANGSNGHAEEEITAKDEPVDIEKAKATVTELFMSGAIWNDLDTNNETPGCLAWRLGQKELYQQCVDAGVRAEILMNLMGGYERLEDDDEEEEDDNEEMAEGGELAVLEESSTSIEEAGKPSDPASISEIPTYPLTDVNSADYLRSNLQFSDDKLLDDDANGVMMAWETDIMERTSALLVPGPGLRILNIGFGMGIIDTLFSATNPSSHHIIEAHPAVIAKMDSEDSEFGSEWAAKTPGNVVHKGRWQNVVPQLLEKGEIFDAIYFDTFGEDYGQLKMFFSEYVVGLLSPLGRFGFFNGLGADRRVCYDVYCKVAELDLCDAGFDVEWHDVEVQGLGKEGEGEWEGVKRRYWTLETYRLPVCTFMG